jgi:RNA polymerase sigma factor (sigma-70 family)
VADVPQAGSQADCPGESGAILLRRYIETEADSLHGTLTVYLHSAWPMSHEEAGERAQDVLAEVVTIALTKAADFDPRRSPRAWLLGIGARVVLRQRAAIFAQHQHESGSPQADPEDAAGDEAIFDRLAALSSPDVALTVEQKEEVKTLLAPLSPPARRVVQLGIIAGLKGTALGQALDCKPATARVRLCRALRQLRAAWARPSGRTSEVSQS